MQVTKQQLASFFEDTNDSTITSFIDPLNKTFAKFNIDNLNRVAMFLAQVGDESGGLKRIQENLNYSAERLVQVFPKYFHGVNPASYAHNPQKIANRVYANRMGNGNEQSGDGYKFRGRGLIQITGHDNYAQFAKDLGMSIDDAVKYFETPEGAAMSAGWFWNRIGCNPYADKKDIITVTKKINGGEIGLADRKKYFAEALKKFA